jgi:tRNA-(ms[2]io[6]A)-hydroxylase
MLRLRQETSADWIHKVFEDFDLFLQDHAANERKVAQAALRLCSHHPDKAGLVDALTDIAAEEMDHFRQVQEIVITRGQTLGPDRPDPYTGQLHALIRRVDHNEYLLDRLLLFGLIEARGCERFQRIAEALEAGPVKDFYRELAASESRHYVTYIRLARKYFGDARTDERLDFFLDKEAEIVRSLPVRAALH